MRYNMVTTSSYPKGVLQRAFVDVGWKTVSFESALLEPSITIIRETGLSLMEWMMAAHTVTKAIKNMEGTGV